MGDEKAHELQQLGIRLEWAYPLEASDALGEVIAPLFTAAALGERDAEDAPRPKSA